jgi:hypothetical protein
MVTLQGDRALGMNSEVWGRQAMGEGNNLVVHHGTVGTARARRHRSFRIRINGLGHAMAVCKGDDLLIYAF